MRFQVTSKLIRPNSWITQTVRQRILNCWAHNREAYGINVIRKSTNGHSAVSAVE